MLRGRGDKVPYRLSMELQSGAATEHFEREFGHLLDAKRYAHNQVLWTVREDHLDGLAPEYAFRIKAVGEDAGKPLDLDGETSADTQSDSLFTPQGPVDDSR